MELFVIAGHGAGDPGACADGYSEASLVRLLAARIKKLGGDKVGVGDTDVNWYKSNYIGKGKCPKGVPVVELHMDCSESKTARGGHVIINAGLTADDYDKRLGEFIRGFFPGRSVTISKRSDLANPKRAQSMGVNYRLLECGFISNQSDRTKFIDMMDELARGILAAFGITAEAPARLPYVVRVKADVLNVRSGPGTNYGIAAQVRRGEAYTITAESGNWGRLKSGAGWVSLSYTERV